MLHYGSETPGTESISPDTTRELGGLGVNLGHEFHEVVAWWGSEEESRAPCPGARVVQRQELARELRRQAHKAGATLLVTTRLLALEQTNKRWRVQHEHRAVTHVLGARYIVDASGRAAAAGRKFGAKRPAYDDLYCISASIPAQNCVGVWTESVPHGWWNLCSDGKLATLSFFSTPEVIRSARLNFVRLFLQTHHLRSLVLPGEVMDTRVRAANSTITRPCAGPGWVCVGDAAMTFQPLASAGIAKALAEAANVCQFLNRPGAYNSLQQQSFNGYVRQLASHYCTEKRWPAMPFWIQATRQSTPLPVSLGPRKSIPTLL
jgi:flavin-dependent dehydrogenase